VTRLAPSSLSASGLRRLLDSPGAGAIEDLDLGRCEIGDRGARMLAESTTLTRLRRLTLGSYGLGARGLCARNGITAAGAAALCRSPALAKLTWLGLPIYEATADLNRARIGSPLARFLFLYPGAQSARTESPDGRWTAELTAARELWGDGPNTGTLRLSGGLLLPDASPSVVWSEDSTKLAVPRWHETDGVHLGKARLTLVDLEAGTERSLPGLWDMPALWGFSATSLAGYAPVDEARPFAIPL
jgi:hypothetical protein